MIINKGGIIRILQSLGGVGGEFLVNVIMNQPKSSQATPLSAWAINKNKN